MVAQQKAELIFVNARIYTLDAQNHVYESMAVGGGKVLKVGTNKEALRLKTRTSRIIDAKGKAIIPGIFDSHLHVIRGGRFYNTELRWDGVTSLKVALNRLKEQAARTPRGQWVRVVGGWNAYQFDEKRLPTLDEINQATGDVPTFVLHLYGHAYLNKAGLKALNITAETPSPPGGLIEKDVNGNPTGLLVAEPNAFLLYATLAKLPELTPDEKRNSTQRYMSELNRFGITSVMDAGGGFQNYPDDYGTTGELCIEDGLTVRIPYFLFAQKGGREYDDYSNWIRTVEIGAGCDHEDGSHPHDHTKGLDYYVQGGGENIVAAAADFENFDRPRPELSPNMEEQLKKVLSLLVKNRWPFRIHATYNESITRFLNVIESVNAETPLNGLVWFFDHAETISEENLGRVQKLGGGIAIQHRMAFQGESFIKRYGKKAAEHTPPVKKMVELGIPVGMGSDGTRVSSYNPWIGLYWLVTGKTVGGTHYMADDNQVDRITALRLYTQGSARLIRKEGDRGQLKEGFLADFALLSDDYFQTDAEKIKSIEAELTVVNGTIVYGAGDFKQLGPTLPAALPDWSPVNTYGGYQN